MMKLLGIFALLAAGAAFLIYLRVSYLCQGGRLNQDPCVAAATVQVPLLGMLGWSMLDGAFGGFGWPWWQWPALWLAASVGVALAMYAIGDFAWRRARSRP